MENKEIQRTHGRLESSELLYRKVWWRLANISGYDIVTSVGGSLTFWVIYVKSDGRLANILGYTVKSGGDASTFYNDTVRFGGDFTNILTRHTSSSNSATRTSGVWKRLCFSSAFELTKLDDSVHILQ